VIDYTKTFLVVDHQVRRVVVAVTKHARRRGELGGSPSPLALNVGHAVVMWEFTHTHRPPTDDELAELVDTVWLPAIRASAGEGPKAP